MCEHCGRETFGPIRELHQDHLAILSACARLSDALSAGDRKVAHMAQAELTTLLDAHERDEEDGLYRELAMEAPEYVAARLAEHDAVGRLLRSALDDAHGDEVLRRGAARLCQHIFTEEQDLFPYALQTLSRSQWEAIEGGQMASRGWGNP